MSENQTFSDSARISDRPKGLDFRLTLYRLKAFALRYWSILVSAITIGLAIACYYTLQLPVQYTSNAKMMVTGHVSVLHDATYSENLMYFYQTQVGFMKLQTTMDKAAAEVRAKHPDVIVDSNAKMSASWERDTEIFDLQVTASNPKYARYLLDAIMDAYLADRQNRKDQTSNEATVAVTQEVSRLDGQIRDDEAKLMEFEKANSIAFIDDQSSNAESYLLELNNELARLVKARDLLALRGGNAVAAPAAPDGAAASSGAGDDTIVEVENELDRLKILRDSYGVYLQDKHPKMVSLNDSIDQKQKFLDVLKQRSAEEQSAGRKDLDLQITNLQKQIAEWNRKLIDLGQLHMVSEHMKEQLARETALFNQLTASMQDIKLDKSIDQGELIILEPAGVATAVPPDYYRLLANGLMGGLIVGLFVAYFISRLDDRIYSSFDLSDAHGFRIVGQIPQTKGGKRIPLLSERDDRYLLTESHRNIRSSIMFGGADQPRSLLVTSAMPNEGKSTLASNLAITFALAGSRTLLIDADMRRGVLHSLFGTHSSPGLSDYLYQQIAWQEAIHATDYSHLHLLPLGKIQHFSNDLLLTPLVDQLLQESLQHYDMVLWDSAPLLPIDDSANLCSKVSGVLFVTRVGLSSSHLVQSALERLSQKGGKVFGMVVNGVELSQPGYYESYVGYSPRISERTNQMA